MLKPLSPPPNSNSSSLRSSAQIFEMEKKIHQKEASRRRSSMSKHGNQLRNLQAEHQRELEEMAAELQRLQKQMEKFQEAIKLGGGEAGSTKQEKYWWSRRKVRSSVFSQ